MRGVDCAERIPASERKKDNCGRSSEAKKR